MKTIITIAIASLILTSSQLFGQNSSINFIEQDFEKAKATAKSQGKYIFMDAYTTWCGPCKWMAKNMFTNDTIAQFYNQHFVNLKVDMEDGIGEELAKRYQVKYYPTTLILDAEGNVLHRSVGASRAVKDYIDFGLTGLNPLTRLNAFENAWNAGDRSEAFIKTYLKIREEAALENESILAAFYENKTDAQLINEPVWNIIFEFDKSVDSKGMNSLLKNREEFSNRYSKEKVEQRLYENYLNHLYAKVYAKNFSMKDMEMTMIDIKQKQIPYWEKIILLGDLAHLKKEKKFKDYCEVATEDIGNYFDDDPEKLNAFAWNVFQWSKKKEQLEVALIWANLAVAQNDSPAILDTQANLLYKLDRKEEARTQQQKAIDKLKANGEDASDYEETLASFK
jgi:thiol-disulfide isomerase/thioredoxin